MDFEWIYDSKLTYFDGVVTLRNSSRFSWLLLFVPVIFFTFLASVFSPKIDSKLLLDS